MEREKENTLALGRRIARARKKKGLSQAGLAARLNISFQAVSRWERGESEPEIFRLRPLAKALGLTLEELLGDSENAGGEARRD